MTARGGELNCLVLDVNINANSHARSSGKPSELEIASLGRGTAQGDVDSLRRVHGVVFVMWQT